MLHGIGCKHYMHRERERDAYKTVDTNRYVDKYIYIYRYVYIYRKTDIHNMYSDTYMYTCICMFYTTKYAVNIFCMDRYTCRDM